MSVFPPPSIVDFQQTIQLSKHKSRIMYWKWSLLGIFVGMQILLESNRNFNEKGRSLGWKWKFMNTGDIKFNRKMRKTMWSRKTRKNPKYTPGNCKGGRFCTVLHFSCSHCCFSSRGGGVFTLPFVSLPRTSQTNWFCDNVF